jgi:hypothetical protein
MSRTNPSKKKRSVAATTLLVFGEGLGEEMFIKHLRSIYSHNTNVSLIIKKGRGGTADGIVIDACNTPGAFDRRVVVLDNDKGSAELSKAQQIANKRRVEMILHTPCIEALLLAILNPKNNYRNKTSALCKKEFESNHIPKKKRADPSEYEKLFSKKILDEQRSKLPELNALLVLVSGLKN